MSRRFLTRSLSALAVGLGLTAPRALPAQNYTQQMQGYMNNYAQAAISRGYSPVTAMVTGSLNGGANASHTVTLTQGRNYVIIGVCDRDCTDVDLRLYSADGSTTASDVALDDHPTLQFTAPASGNFRLQVDMATCSHNPCFYGVQLFGGASSGIALAPQPMAMQPQPMAMQPQPMAIGAPTQMGTIGANQQVSGNLTTMDGRWDGKPAQTWGFACQAGQSFQMDILSTWDNYAIVFDPMGTPVAHDDDGGPEVLNARITHSCAMTGVYRLAVTTYTANTTPGSYTLQVQSMAPTMAMAVPQPMPMQPQPMATPPAMPQGAPGATLPQAAPLSLPITGGIPAPGQVGTITAGTNVQGRLETGDQRMNDGTYADVWQFQGTAGQHVIIELRSEEFDTYVQLLDSQGNRLAEDDDSLGDLDSRVEITLASTGMFQIVVNNFGEDHRMGSYTLTLR
jgi:hypothetical protein